MDCLRVAYFGFGGCRCCLYGCSMVDFGVNVVLGLVAVFGFGLLVGIVG